MLPPVGPRIPPGSTYNLSATFNTQQSSILKILHKKVVARGPLHYRDYKKKIYEKYKEKHTQTL